LVHATNDATTTPNCQRSDRLRLFIETGTRRADGRTDGRLVADGGDTCVLSSPPALAADAAAVTAAAALLLVVVVLTTNH